MGKLIDADELLNRLPDDLPYKASVRRVLMQAPEGVVRCKDCKHYRNHPNGLCYMHTEPYENKKGFKGDAVCVEPDDFCSYGERKDDAHEPMGT